SAPSHVRPVLLNLSHHEIGRPNHLHRALLGLRPSQSASAGRGAAILCVARPIPVRSDFRFIMTNFFESPFKGKLLSEQVTRSNITVGRYSYYSGYYHGHSFDDCARFLLPD